MTPIPIRYRDFYDIPRAFLVERAGEVYFFDCAFDDRLDEYPDTYRVYVLDANSVRHGDEGSWEYLRSVGRFLGEALITAVEFDPTRRATVEDSVFDLVRSAERE
jgi:hypothetical protein